MFDMMREMLAQPLWLQIWIGWLVVVNTASLLFLKHREGRWILAAWLANSVLITTIFELNGYNRLLGLSHVLCWTPLLIYLWKRRESSRGPTTYARWLRTLFFTDLASLVIDYVDLLRYLLGDRS